MTTQNKYARILFQFDEGSPVAKKIVSRLSNEWLMKLFLPKVCVVYSTVNLPYSHNYQVSKVSRY